MIFYPRRHKVLCEEIIPAEGDDIMKKRVFAIFCAGMLAVSTVTGCGNNAGAADTAASVTQGSTAAGTDSMASEGADAEAVDSTASESAAAEETAAAEAPGIDISVMKPWVNSNIKGVVTDDVTADIKDDFYLAVNHDWLRDTELYPGRGSATPWMQAVDMVKERCFDILADESLQDLEGTEGHDAKLIQNYYRQYLDWESRNKAGLEPVMPAVDALRAVETMEDLQSFLLSDTYDRFSTQDAPPLVPVGISNYIKNSDLYQVDLAPTPLLLEDSAEYKSLTENGKRVKKQKETLVSYMLGRIGMTDEEAQKVIDNVNRLDAALAEHIRAAADVNDPSYIQASVNPVTMDEVRDLSPGYPLAQIMEQKGWSGAERINVLEPEALKALNALFTEDNVEALRDKLLVNILWGYISYLDEPAYREFIKAVMEKYGLTEEPETDFRAYINTRSIYPDSFARLYIRKYVDESMRTEIRQICQDVIDTYDELIDTTDWLLEETRKKAKNKLSKITINAVYPDKWEDYSGYQVNEDGGIMTARLDYAKAKERQDISKMNGAVDREIWKDIDILDTNAFYHPNYNSINIVPGFFCDVTYRSDMSIEEKYGSLGAVIGHEISHAFDSNGAQFDENGSLNDWWTDADKKAFGERVSRVESYFDNIVAYDDGTPNIGKLVQAEATADMGGIRCMLKMAEKIDGFDYDKFFRTYARLWQRLESLQMSERSALSDPHPRCYQRTNVTLQQFDEFLETYDIKEGDGMYLAPQDRIAVW